jgi:hypothetical protein
MHLSLRGFQPRLVEQNGKVEFLFQDGVDLLHALSGLVSGALVDALRFIRAVKYMRSQIYAVRREKEMAMVASRPPLPDPHAVRTRTSTRFESGCLLLGARQTFTLSTHYGGDLLPSRCSYRRAFPRPWKIKKS